MNIKFKFVICVLLLLFPIKGFAETIYDQPYLGEFPDFFRERLSALALKQLAWHEPELRKYTEYAVA